MFRAPSSNSVHIEQYAISKDNPIAIRMLHPHANRTNRTNQKVRHLGHFKILDKTLATASDNPIWCAKVAANIAIRAVSNMIKPQL